MVCYLLTKTSAGSWYLADLFLPNNNNHDSSSSSAGVVGFCGGSKQVTNNIVVVIAIIFFLSLSARVSRRAANNNNNIETIKFIYFTLQELPRARALLRRLRLWWCRAFVCVCDCWLVRVRNTASNHIISKYHSCRQRLPLACTMRSRHQTQTPLFLLQSNWIGIRKEKKMLLQNGTSPTTYIHTCISICNITKKFINFQFCIYVVTLHEYIFHCVSVCYLY